MLGLWRCIRSGGHLGPMRSRAPPWPGKGLRAACPATGERRGSAKMSAGRGQSMHRARPSADLARRFCMRGGQPARRAPRALETVEKVLTAPTSQSDQPMTGTSVTGSRSATRRSPAASLPPRTALDGLPERGNRAEECRRGEPHKEVALGLSLQWYLIITICWSAWLQ